MLQLNHTVTDNKEGLKLSDFHKTIIEFYDDEPIFNVLAAAQFKPTRVVFLGTNKLDNRLFKNNIKNCFKHLGISVKCDFYVTDMMNFDSVISELRTILENFDDCAVDITGGSEVALVATGMLSREYRLPLFCFDRYSGTYRNIHNCPAADGVCATPDFSVDAMLAMTGAVMKSHGHLSVDVLDSDTEADIFKIWSVYKTQYKSWHKLVGYLQQVSKQLEGDVLHVSAPTVVYGAEHLSSVNGTIMEKLSDSGMILNYSNDGKRVHFDYKNTLIKSCLCDAGICLELYVFAAALRAGIYNDVRISVVIDWDGVLNDRINTINEIDVLIMNGFVPLFVSCKSGSPSVAALNEIKTLANKFGGVNARAVLVTMSDVRERDKYLAKRAEDMGVEIIDRADLTQNRLSKRLYNISRF